MNKRHPPGRAQRYQELLEIAADRHHTAVTDSRAIFEAGTRLLHETMTAQMIAGEAIDAGVYMKVSEQLQALIPPPAPVKVEVEIIGPTETMCPKCGCQFDPDSPERTIEKMEVAKIAALPSATTPAENDSLPASEVQTSAPVPARPAPPIPVPVNPPPKPVHNSATAEWERQRGYNRSARDGGMIRGAPVPHQDPNLPGVASGRYENYANDKPVTWNGYMDGRRQYGGATPDINPNYNSDGSPRAAHKAPY